MKRRLSGSRRSKVPTAVLHEPIEENSSPPRRRRTRISHTNPQLRSVSSEAEIGNCSEDDTTSSTTTSGVVDDDLRIGVIPHLVSVDEVDQEVEEERLERPFRLVSDDVQSVDDEIGGGFPTTKHPSPCDDHHNSPSASTTASPNHSSSSEEAIATGAAAALLLLQKKNITPTSAEKLPVKEGIDVRNDGDEISIKLPTQSTDRGSFRKEGRPPERKTDRSRCRRGSNSSGGRRGAEGVVTGGGNTERSGEMEHTLHDDPVPLTPTQRSQMLQPTSSDRLGLSPVLGRSSLLTPPHQLGGGSRGLGSGGALDGAASVQSARNARSVPVIESHDPEATLPWGYREVQDRKGRYMGCNFMTTSYFWDRVRWALQFALIAVFPAATLTLHPNTSDFFQPPVMVLSFCVVTTNSTLGRGVGGLLDLSKAVAVMYGLLTVIFAIQVAASTAAFFIVYVVGTLLIAFLTDGIVTKNAMLMFAIGMSVHWNGNIDIKFPTFLVRDICIGTGLGLASSSFPIWDFEYKAAENHVERIATNLAVYLLGVCDSFFSSSNVQRTANIVKLRAVRRDLDFLMKNLEQNIQFGWYEPVIGLRMAELDNRRVLFQEAIRRVDSMMTVVQRIQRSPQSLNEKSVCSRRFRSFFGEEFQQAGTVIDRFLHAFCWRRKAAEDNEILVQHQEQLATKFESAMSEAYLILADPDTSNDPNHGNRISGIMKEVQNFPMRDLGFFVFNLNELFNLFLKFEEPEVWTLKQRFGNVVMVPVRVFRDVVKLSVGLLMGDQSAIIKFVYAIKLSFSMTTCMAVIVAIGKGDSIFGPAVIAFVSGADATQTLQTSQVQLMGTVFGSVVGFLLASLSSDTYSLVLCAVLIALVTGFFRSSEAYGLGAFFAQFAAFASITPNLDPAFALISIQTNTAAIMWYVCVSSFILPANPSVLLFQELTKGFKTVKDLVASMNDIIQDDTDASAASRVPSMTGVEHANPVLKVHSLSELELTSTGRQLILLDGAAAEPVLSRKPFPAAMVRSVIYQQREIVALLSPLALAWGQLKHRLDEHSDRVLAAIIPRLAVMAKEVENLMGLLVLLLDRDVATLTRLLVKSCLALEEVSKDLANEQVNLVCREALRVSRDGGYLPTDAATDEELGGDSSLSSASLNAMVYCCVALSDQLYELFQSVSSMRHALTSM